MTDTDVTYMGKAIDFVDSHLPHATCLVYNCTVCRPSYQPIPNVPSEHIKATNEILKHIISMDERLKRLEALYEKHSDPNKE